MFKTSMLFAISVVVGLPALAGHGSDLFQTIRNLDFAAVRAHLTKETLEARDISRSLRFTAAMLVLASALYSQNQPFRPAIPKVWDEAALAEWATPVAGLNVRPTHISSSEYYSAPEHNLRSYPVYMPGREPDGYWEMLQSIGPKPLIEPATLKTEADWLQAGQRVFDEATTPHLTVFDPQVIRNLRGREYLEGQRAAPLADGTLGTLRWVPTKQGVALSTSMCGGCHMLFRSDGVRIPGLSSRTEVSRTRPFQAVGVRADFLEAQNHVMRGASPFHMGVGSLGSRLYQAFGVPWLNNDPNLRLKSIIEEEYAALVTAERNGGAITRWGGSPLFPAKIPDLIGVKDRKYLDHTATHLHRGIGDLMRYAAQVTFAEMTDFGPHHVLSAGTKRTQARVPDEAFYALALYIYSLKPPPNPNPLDEKARAGQKVFAGEGCAGCHTPPLYTNNRVTLAQGFTPPRDKPASIDVLPVSVGTDPGLALATRKGTGYYKIPSLKGAWYRGHYLHDGSVASLEEMFDPDRLRDSHVPGGYCPPGLKGRAIKGHEFGLKLKPEEKESLLAFLRTL